MKKRLLTILAVPALLTLGLANAASKDTAPATDAELAKKVVHEVRMYSWYTLWDNINVRVQDGNVELLGQVNQPYKKSDLGKIIQHVPGVRSVNNELEVLPLSNFDDQLRIQVARNIYRDPVLSRYSMGVDPSIHIIVDNGHVTLEGIVNNEMEKNIAGMRASQSMSFGAVTNNLRVENSPKKS